MSDKRPTPAPVFRRLRGYSFDPSLSVQLETALFNENVFKIPWEKDLKTGPVGEYLEVVDFDPASKCFYDPVDLNDAHILAQDGLSPSESNPQFHQQMVYAVAMTTINNFERALGRKALWSTYRNKEVGPFLQRLRIYPHAMRQANAYYSPSKIALLFGYFPASSDRPGEHIPNGIVFTCLSHDIVAHETTHALLDGMHRRFIEPSHKDTLAFHEAFADIVALFQHFSFSEVLRQQIAKTRGDLASQSLLGQLAQQFGRAIGNYGALRDAIGDFDEEKKQWKPREADPDDYQTVTEPHARGAILVAAVFEAFLSIYKSRVADILRIASNGTGILSPGELHPDLVKRLADQAAKTAQHVLNMCIRALDYCPPVDISFGDYLRAIISADIDLVPDDDLDYRIAFIEAFRRRGIYPRDLRTLSEESLCWNEIREDQQQGIFRVIAGRLRFFVHQLSYLDEFPDLDKVEALSDGYKTYLKKFLITNKEQRWNQLRHEEKESIWRESFNYDPDLTADYVALPGDLWKDLDDAGKKTAERMLWHTMSDREKIYSLTQVAQGALHRWLGDYKADANSPDIEKFEDLTGLYFLSSPTKNEKVRGLKSKDGKYSFEVHSFRDARRVGPDGSAVNEVIISITQKRVVPLDDPFETVPEELNPNADVRDFVDNDIINLKEFINKLRKPTEPVSEYVSSRLSEQDRATINQPNAFVNPKTDKSDLFTSALVILNEMLDDPKFYNRSRFKKVTLSPRTAQLLTMPTDLKKIRLLNQSLICDAFSQEIVVDPFTFRGGCTLIFDLQTLKLKYVVRKRIDNKDERLTRQRRYRNGEDNFSLQGTYFGRTGLAQNGETFAMLHGDF